MSHSSEGDFPIPPAVRMALELMSITWDLTELDGLEALRAQDYAGTREWPFVHLALRHQRERIWDGVSRRSPAAWS